MHETPKFMARFWSKVVKGDGCWTWSAYRTAAGYGRINEKGTVLYAHRVSYEMCFGAIPDDRCICHHCDNPACVRPDHLFVGTMADNNRDKARKGRTINPLTDELKQRTHCPKGHAYDEVNTLWRPAPNGCGMSRACRACLREWNRRRHARERGDAYSPRREGYCRNGHTLPPPPEKRGSHRCPVCAQEYRRQYYARRRTLKSSA